MVLDGSSMATLVTFFISLSYAVPSIALYLITICIIYGHKKSFDSSFFRMYVYDCFMNLLTYTKTFSTMRLPSVTCYDCVFASVFMGLNNYIPMPFLFSIGYHMAYVQYATTTLISLNRLTVLLNFNLFEPGIYFKRFLCKILWRRFAWLLMLAVLLFPFVNTRVAWNYPASFGYVNTTDSYSLTSKMPVWEVYSVLIPFMIISIIASLVANIASLVFVKNVKLVKANRAESNFIIITSITCSIQLIGTVLSVGMLALQQSSLISLLSFIQLYVSDGLTLVQPWLLLFFSHGIRDKMKRMFGLKKKTPVASMNSLFKKNVIFLNFIISMGYHMAYVQYSITALVSLNRLSVLLKWNLFEPLWKKYTWILIVLIYFIPFLNTGIAFKYSARIEYVNISNCYAIVSTEMPVMQIYGVLLPFMILTMVLSVVCNVVSIAFVHNLKTHKHNRAEKNFLIMMSITCFIQLLGTILTLSLMFIKMAGIVYLIFSQLLPTISDGLSLVQPWLLIVFSHGIREKAKAMMGMAPKKSTAQILVRSVTN